MNPYDPPENPAPDPVPASDLEATRQEARQRIASLEAESSLVSRALTLVQSAAWYALSVHSSSLGNIGDSVRLHPLTHRRALVTELAHGAINLDEWARMAHDAMAELEDRGLTDAIEIAWLSEPVFKWADRYGTPTEVALDVIMETRERIIDFLASDISQYARPQPWVEMRPEDSIALRAASRWNESIAPISIEATSRRIGRFVCEGYDLQKSRPNGGFYLWSALAANFQRLRLRLRLTTTIISKTGKPEWPAMAIAVAASNPDLTKQEIADLVGKHVGTLYRNKAVAEVLKGRPDSPQQRMGQPRRGGASEVGPRSFDEED